jgi:hypothetical protein
MKKWFQKTKKHFTSKEFLESLLVALLLLIVSFIVNFYAGQYATLIASNSVTDIVLSNIKTYDLNSIFINGPVYFWIFVAILVVSEPKRIPFVIKSIALFVIVRSIFISLTHIGPFPTQIVLDANNMIDKFAFGGDLFFSGHTGLPFLIALIFWNHKFLRYIFIATSVMFGAVVLLAHIHYSIDVLSAFFITYTIYKISVHLFRKDLDLFYS